MNRLAIIATIFYLSIGLAIAQITTPSSILSPNKTINTTATDIIDPPHTAALNIMVDALSSLKELKKQNQASFENIKALIKIKMLPNMAIGISTELALKEHWHKLNNQQKLIFQTYITQSLIKDYAGILATYNKLGSINISVDSKVRRQDNKAIVNMMIKFDNPEPVVIALKMIRSTHWQIYDIAFSGVSLIKNYRAQFNSQIKRKSIESLIAKTLKKIN